MKKLNSIIVICFMVMVFHFAQGPTWVFAADKIKFCTITALSGPAAPWGIPSARGIRLGAEDINDNGGFTVKGKVYEWDLIEYDHKYVPAEAVKAANRAIYSDKVGFMSIMGGGRPWPASP